MFIKKLLTKRYLSILFFSILILSSFLNIRYVLAENSNITIEQEKTNPDSKIAYTLKRVFEKIEGFKVDRFNKDQKIKFMTKLANRRLSELKYIIEKKDINDLEKTNSRYISWLGSLVEELEKNKTDAKIVEENLKIHVAELEKLKDTFPAQSSNWLFVQQAIETAKVTLSKTENILK